MQQMTCSTYIQRKILNVALSLNSYFSLYSTWFHQYILQFQTVSRDALWCPFIPLDSTNISHNSRPSREMRYGVPLFHLIPPIYLTIPDRLARCVMVSLYSTWFHQYISQFQTVSRDALWCTFIPLDSTNTSHYSRPSREMRYVTSDLQPVT